MNRLLFHYSEFEQIYNCSSNMTEHLISGREVSNLPMGYFYMIIGVAYEIVYIPFLVVMLRKEFFQHSCYKIMFWIGILDIIEIPIISILAGYDTILGDFFCLNPIRNYVLGCFSNANWFGASFAAILLATNRCLELCAPKYAEKFFDGMKTIVWLFFLTGFWIYSLFFHMPCIYTSLYFACFFDPYFGTKYVDPIKFANYYHDFHDIFVFVVLIFLYVIICIRMWVKYKQVKQNSIIIKQQRILHIQAAVICIQTFFTCAIYVYMQHFSTPKFVIAMGHIFWQSLHGDIAFVYLILNGSLRRAVGKLFRQIFCCKSAKMAVQQVQPYTTQFHNTTYYQH